MIRQPSLAVRRAALIATLVLMPVAAAAQAGNSGSLPNMPAWDGNFSLGLLSGDIEGPNDRSDRLEARFDVGRYWTSHVKTELGLSVPTRWSSYDYTNFPVPGLPGGGFASSQQSQQLVMVAPTLTYQFLENAFAHPYLSTGLRLMWLRTHSTRAAQTFTQNRISYAVPALDQITTTVSVRPLVAAGFKSYFNERTFIRTEGLLAFGDTGIQQVALRVGFGLDF